MRNDSRLNFIRALAVVLIVFCHFFQIVGNLHIALWLNTGVQVFFVLSAYLMSQKSFASVRDVLQFYKKRLLRIMLPMWLYTACLVLVLFVLRIQVEPAAILLYAVGGAGFAPTGILGLGHFWYVTVILICYLLVPLLDWISRSKQPWLFTITLSCFAMIAMCLAHKSEYGINLALFALSYLFFRKNNAFECRLSLKQLVILAIPTVLFNIARVFMDGHSFSSFELQDLYEGLFVTLAKSFLGLFVFVLLMKTLKIGSNRKITNYLSKRSYEIYLVHQFILLAVNKYIPLPGKGTAVGSVLVLLVSIILILCNTEALALLTGLFRKTKVKL